MNIVHIGAAIGLAVLIAIGGSTPVANTSETNRPPVTRESRGSSTDENSIRIRGEADYILVNRQNLDVLGFMRMDMDTPSTAELMVSMIDSPYFLDDLDGFEFTDSFRVRNAGECQGLEGYMDYVPVVMIVCADGRYVNMVIATDKQLGIDAAQSVYQDGVLVVPSGYEEERP